MQNLAGKLIMLKNIANVIEAILFISGQAVPLSELKEKLSLTDNQLNEALEIIKNRFNEDSGINILFFNKKVQLGTNPKYADQVAAVCNPIREREMTRVLMETLAIIAYSQPITKGEVEDLRGVDCTYAVQSLYKLNLIQIVGRKDSIGKPQQFGTTDNFLKRFGLNELSDLPDYEILLDKLNNPVSGSTSLYAKRDEIIDEVPDFLAGEDVEIIKAD